MVAPDALTRLAPEWSDLWERCPWATPFQSPEWLLPWWRHLFKGGEQWVLALRCSGRLAGLAPLFIHGHSERPDLRQVSIIGAGITDYLDFLFEPEIACEGVRTILQYLAEQRSRWDVCDFQELRAGSPLLRAELPAGIHGERLSCGICPVLVLPRTPEEFYAKLDAKLRTDVRRARNKLERSGELQFETARLEATEEASEALFRLHQARWQTRDEPGMLASHDRQSFHRDVITNFARRDWLRLYALRYKGSIVAVFYGFLTRGRAYAYLSGFQPELARLSPGTVLLSLAIEEAIREHASEFDFLRKTEEFKHLWGAQDRANGRLLMWHSETAPPTPSS